MERLHIGANVKPYLSVEEMDILKINDDDDEYYIENLRNHNFQLLFF